MAVKENVEKYIFDTVDSRNVRVAWVNRKKIVESRGMKYTHWVSCIVRYFHNISVHAASSSA